MKRRFWMLVHDLAEKLWHYAYYKAYPKPKRDSGTWHYQIAHACTTCVASGYVVLYVGCSATCRYAARVEEYAAGREFKGTEWKE